MDQKNLSAINALNLSGSVLHADETGTNISVKGHWIHVLCNESFSYFHVDPKRGNDSMDRMSVLRVYSGVLVHDHWKSYFAVIMPFAMLIIYESMKEI